MRSWAVDRPVNSPFARPKGLVGRLAGRFMLRTNKQAGLVPLLDAAPGSRVLEVGFGPGGLIRVLVRRGVLVCGVDPSPDMIRVAGRVNRAAVRDGRIELRLGTAERIGYPDEEFDRVVSVNNVAIWPNLEAGLAELHRVLRPGGTVLISWHGGSDPSRIVRGLTLPADKLARIRDGLTALFGTVSRHELTSSTVFLAKR